MLNILNYVVGVVREELVSDSVSTSIRVRDTWGEPGFSAGSSPAGAAQLGGCGDVGSAAVDFASATMVAAASIHADEPVAVPAPGHHNSEEFPEMNMQVVPREHDGDVAREQEEPPHE